MSESSAQNRPNLETTLRVQPGSVVSPETVADADPRLSAPTPVAELVIGGFRVKKELGRGGMGVVYLAEDPELKRLVALKVLPAGFATSADARIRFQREAEIASRLDHPNLCGVLRIGTSEGVSWIAMRHVPGRPLSEQIKRLEHDAESSTLATRAASRQALRLRQPLVELVEKVARALDLAHAKGVIHRDLKPGNIMVTPEGEPVVLDFGLAQDLCSDGPALTQSGDVLGTPSYMAPEQIRGASNRADARTDVWALGVILYELLTLRRPFSGATRDALYRNILESEPVAPSRRIAGLPRDLDTVVATALEKDPDRRYATARDLADDLRAVIEIKPVKARPVGPLGRAVRFAKRRRALAALIVLSIVVTPIVATLIVRQIAGDERIRASAGRAVVRCEEALARHRLIDARGALDELSRTSPEDRRRDGLGRIVALGERLDAVETLVLDAETDPDGDRAWRALDALDREFPGTEKSFIWRALVRLRTRREDEARKLLANHPELLESLAGALPPDDAPAATRLFAAMSLAEQGRLKDAVAILELLLESDPTSASLAWIAAETSTRMQDYRSALAYAGRSRALAGGFSPARLGRYSVHLRRAGHRAEALPIAEEALRRDPENRSLRLYRANALSELGRKDESLRELDGILADEPAFAVAHWIKSTELHELRRFDEALAESEEAIKLDPRMAESWLMKGNSLLELQRDDDAVPALERAIELRPDFLFAFNSLGTALVRGGRGAEGRKAFQSALQRDPTYAEAWHGLGLALWIEKDEPGAIAAFLRAHELGPRFVQPVVKLGTLNFRRNENVVAETWFRRALEMDPNDDEALTNLSVIRRDAGDNAEAIELASRGVAVNPKDVNCLRNLISAQLQVGQFEDASKNTWIAHALDPTSADVMTPIVALDVDRDPVAALAAAMRLDQLGSPNLAIVNEVVQQLDTLARDRDDDGVFRIRRLHRLVRSPRTEDRDDAIEIFDAELASHSRASEPVPGTRDGLVWRAVAGEIDRAAEKLDRAASVAALRERLRAFDAAATAQTALAHRGKRVRD